MAYRPQTAQRTHPAFLAALNGDYRASIGSVHGNDGWENAACRKGIPLEPSKDLIEGRKTGFRISRSRFTRLARRGLSRLPRSAS
jgi:hypothetical protein